MEENKCDCCEGTQILTPASVANRPGLSALAYRVGTHARFLETMKARLSNMPIDIPNPDDPAHPTPAYPLRSLTTRASNDPAIALLDGWATIADVLTFYQERIANEGFLRTATERRSVLEMARLIGYALRPGVAASVFLALELDKNHDVLIRPREIKAQSVPGPGEMPQVFENGEPLDARYAWNKLQPRMARPQTINSILNGDADGNIRLYVKGINTNLKQNDVILLTTGNSPLDIYHVASIAPDPNNDRTLVVFQEKASEFTTLHQAIDFSGMVAVAEGYIAARPKAGRKPASEMAQRVVGHLKILIENVQASNASMQTMREIIAKISEERDVAVGEQYTKLASWLGGMVEKLNEAVDEMSASATTESVPTFVASSSRSVIGNSENDLLKQTIVDLTKRASIPPRNTLNLSRKLENVFSGRSDSGLQISKAFDAKLGKSLPAALANVQVKPESDLHAYVFRAVARPFGHNAPPRPERFDRARQIVINGEWKIDNPLNEPKPIAAFKAKPISGDAPLKVKFINLSFGVNATYSWDFGDNTTDHAPNPSHEFKVAGIYTVRLTVTSPLGEDTVEALINVTGEIPMVMAFSAKRTVEMPVPLGYHTSSVLYLDAEYNIKVDSWVAIARSGIITNKFNLQDIGGVVAQQSLAAYGISGKATRLDLNADSWLSAQDDFSAVRQTLVYVQSEELLLAEEPVVTAVCDGQEELIELDELYSGMQSGRWVVISGERTDIKDAKDQSVVGVKASELAMLAEVIQDIAMEDGEPLPGDKTHTWIRLAKKLEYCYRRDSVTIHGNVLKATHGETRKEILGNGDASHVFQSFALKQSPLTFTSSPTPAGAESSLNVYVNDVLWHESESMANLAKTDRKFVTKTDDTSKTTIIFGNGKRGARLPTGAANIRAEYRSGIGRPGNVQVEQISLLTSKPLGVQSVINPLHASGGADRESMDTARKNAPLTVTALDRLVSISDYAYFARTFAGVGKSVAAQLTDGRGQVVHITIAGADDIPIDETSDLYYNLLLALRNFGDPSLPVVLQVRELLLIFLSANIRIMPDYQWDIVAKAVRAKLLNTFSFERRELGQDVLLSEVIAAIQSVRGVAYVDVDFLGGIPEKITEPGDDKPIRRLLTPQEISQAVQSLITRGTIDPSQPERSQPLQRLPVSLSSVDHPYGSINPAQLAYLTPDVADTLLLNQVK